MIDREHELARHGAIHRRTHHSLIPRSDATFATRLLAASGQIHCSTPGLRRLGCRHKDSSRR
jgi:hypothetical protein